MTTKKPQNKWKGLLSILLLVTGIIIALDVVTTFVTTPTPKHVETYRRTSELSAPTGENLDKDGFLKPNPELDQLTASAEAKYTLYTTGAVFVTSLVMYIWLIFFSYGRIRKQRLTNSPVGATVIINTIAGFIGTVVSLLIGYALYGNAGIPTEGPVLFYLLIGTLLIIPFSVGATILIAYIAKAMYDKKHSMIVE